MVSDHIIIICFSIHDIMKAEQILCHANIWNDLIPVPKEINPDCGMAIKIYDKDKQTVCLMLEQNLVHIREIYRTPGQEKLYQQISF